MEVINNVIGRQKMTNRAYNQDKLDFCKITEGLSLTSLLYECTCTKRNPINGLNHISVVSVFFDCGQQNLHFNLN